MLVPALFSCVQEMQCQKTMLVSHPAQTPSKLTPEDKTSFQLQQSALYGTVPRPLFLQSNNSPRIFLHTAEHFPLETTRSRWLHWAVQRSHIHDTLNMTNHCLYVQNNLRDQNPFPSFQQQQCLYPQAMLL